MNATTFFVGDPSGRVAALLERSSLTQIFMSVGLLYQNSRTPVEYNVFVTIVDNFREFLEQNQLL